MVQGPAARETVMRKERFLGLWLNTGRQGFDDVPAYYYIAASQPLQRLLARWGADGIALGTLGDTAADLDLAQVPRRNVVWGQVPGRSGVLALEGG